MSQFQKKARTETEVGMESDFRSPLIKDKRKIDNKEVNDRMVKFLDSRINPEKENHHLSFFKGIIPILNTLTIEETLEFQASVMTMLQKIKSRNYERPNYGHWRDSYNQMTGPDQYSGYYTHNSVNQQATPTQDQHYPGYSTQYNSDNLSAEDRVTLKEFCRRFTRAALQRWQKSNRFLDQFRRLYENWLQANIDWPSCVQSLVNQQPTVDEIPRAHSVSQEPSTSSSVGTSKQKKRRSDDLIGKDSSELAYTAAARLEKEGHEDIASVIEYIMKNPEATVKIIETLKKPEKTVIFTPEKALGLLLSLKLSKWQYITLREATIWAGAKDIYPSYYKVQQTKLDCYPPKQSVSVTDSLARITLQALLDITVTRILQSLSDDVQNKLISKWVVPS
ncbi:unnamed protein product [Arctia plantaginis]|uniref:Uncharacterized protein n=1 Tax=Arctia plantaginis TaxID=874455 RepID=A0A8S1AMU7_ARCPL|nr:unnamed protein product [Arctia plantaginis]CAB3249184.1 unnamed protein product [Arctia plantaginis]